jgi:putative hydrolases of HD superfamily
MEQLIHALHFVLVIPIFSSVTTFGITVVLPVTSRHLPRTSFYHSVLHVAKPAAAAPTTTTLNSNMMEDDHIISPVNNTSRILEDNTSTGNVKETVIVVETESTVSASTLSSKAAATRAIEFARLIGRLKTTPRTGWVRRGVPRYESVADHSWRVAALSFLLLRGDNDDENDMNKIDVSKCIQLAVVHDMAECIIGDIAPDDNVSAEDKRNREDIAVQKLASLLDSALEGTTTTTTGTGKSEISQVNTSFFTELFNEYECRQSNESRAVKDLDLLDMILQADEYEERFDMDLSDFFQSTPESRFNTPILQRMAREVHQQRDDRRRRRCQQTSSTLNVESSKKEEISTGPTTKCDEDTKLSLNDTAFVEEYSKASHSSAESIEHILLAYKQWKS